MKTTKRLLASLFAVMMGVLLLAVPATAFADINHDSNVASSFSDGTYVIDQSSLLKQDEVSKLQGMAKDVADKYQVAAVYMTVNGLDGYSNINEYTSALIDAYSLQTAQPNGCIVFTLCLNTSEYALMSSGALEDKLNEAALDHLSNDIFPYLGRSDWAGAGETFYGDVSQTMSGQTANATSSEAYNGTYVTDNAKLFSDEQRASLEAKATKLAQDYNMGVYLLTVDNMGSNNPSKAERTNFATSFYRANNLGLGSGKDGIMLVLASGSRDYVTIAYGQGSHSFSDEGIESMEDDVKSYLKDNDWFEGAEAYYKDMGEQLEYYKARGKPWTAPDPIMFLLKILAILGIPGFVAYGKVNGERSAMKTAREQSEAANYLQNDTFVLTNSRDEFVNTTLAVTPIPKDDDDKSSSGFGGGGWGGGGGGGFSSSGGGKF